MTDQEMMRAFSKAKIGLMSQHGSVFITTILFNLKHSWCDSINTADVDGINLRINQTWFMGLTPKARIGLLAHEAWHVAFQHMLRSAGLDPEKYNKAADYVINIMLVRKGYELPPNGLVDDKYENMSTRQVYDLLPDEPKGAGGYEGDLKDPGKGQDKAQQASIKEKITNTLVKAVTQAKMSKQGIGKLPGELELVIDTILNPKLDWRVILQNLASSYAKEDYSMVRPNRRFMPEHHLPSLHSESLGEICVAVDTSGSVSDFQFNKFLNEIAGIKERLNPEKLTVIDFDTEIRNVHELSRDQSIKDVSFSGRGGTNLTPVFEYYGKIKPIVLIVFSDLCCRAITENPGYPVIWICTDNIRATVNFGRLIHFDTRN